MSSQASYLLPPPPVPPGPPDMAGGFDPTTLARMRDAAVELLPPGRAFTRRKGSMLARVLEALVAELARVHLGARRALASIVPSRTSDLEALAAWEEAAGTSSEGTVAARAQRAANALRGLSEVRTRAGYQAVAAAHGVTLSWPPVATPPFRAGIGRAGDAVYGDAWSYVLTIPATGPSGAEAAVSAALSTLARAHTIVRVELA